MQDTVAHPAPGQVEEEQEQAEQVMGRLIGEFAASAGVALTLLGIRAGLWEALADRSPATPEEVAAATEWPEPFVREWMRAQAAGNFLHYHPDSQRFALPAGVAAVLTGDQAGFVAAMATQVSTLHTDLDGLEAGLRAGRGFGWHERASRNSEAMDDITRAVVGPVLVSQWLPALDGVAERLAAGGRVADVGCGYGTPTRTVAQAYPGTQVWGFDSDEASVARARQAARATGLADRVRFEVATAKTYPGHDYDLITYFDVFHDLGDPLGALVHARAALASDGVVLLVEPAAADRVEDNFTPIGRFFYAASALVCTPNALAQEGHALGTLAGEAALREVAGRAGFGHVRRVPVDAPFNLLLELRR